MKVYIVRHGEVLHNALKIYNNENEDLNENGVKQAETLKYKIKNLEYDIIISSPLIRAKHTAEIINFKNKDSIGENLKPILSNKIIFAVDLYDEKINLGSKIENYFSEMISKENAVKECLEKYIK